MEIIRKNIGPLIVGVLSAVVFTALVLTYGFVGALLCVAASVIALLILCILGFVFFNF